MAAIGIVIDVMVKKRLELLQISIYLMMGWSCVIEVEALKIALQEQGFQWLLAGGLLYSFGVIFYVLGDKNG
jgi:Predicted membrane protein, hemolysin III homolog